MSKHEIMLCRGRWNEVASGRRVRASTENTKSKTITKIETTENVILPTNNGYFRQTALPAPQLRRPISQVAVPRPLRRIPIPFEARTGSPTAFVDEAVQGHSSTPFFTPAEYPIHGAMKPRRVTFGQPGQGESGNAHCVRRVPKLRIPLLPQQTFTTQQPDT